MEFVNFAALEDDLKHRLVIGSTRSADFGMSAFVNKLAADQLAAGGRVAVFDVGSSFEKMAEQIAPVASSARTK